MVLPIEELILLSLSGRSLYGLDIARAVSECSQGDREIKIGSLYPMLRKLELKGLVRSEWGDRFDSHGGARRRYYELTGEGANLLARAAVLRGRLLDWLPDVDRES